jgi:hypothetical protein
MSKITLFPKFGKELRPPRSNGGVEWMCRTGGGWGPDGAPLGGSSTCIDSPKRVNEVFLTYVYHIDVKKHLICGIWTRFEASKAEWKYLQMRVRCLTDLSSFLKKIKMAYFAQVDIKS